MPSSNSKSGQPWTPTEVKALRELAKGYTPTRVIGVKLGRSPVAVSSKASAQHISLKPTNQSPYGRKK